MKFGKERIALAAELLKDLDKRVVKDGESWARLRSAFSVLLEPVRQRALTWRPITSAVSTSRRDFKGGERAAIRSCRCRATSSARR